MGKVALIFPGQGSQKVGMGRAAAEASPAARAVFEAADEALGEPISRLCFEGPQEALQLTANTQPAVLATSVALWRAMGEPACDAVAGHSLGEWTAHVVAGTLPFEQAVRLVRLRGRFMQEAVPVGQGAMAAVMGPEPEVVERACAEVEGVVEPVNYNAPTQTVIAGSSEAVAEASGRLKDAGARVIPLPVSAPFHSSLMRPAEERLAAHLAEADFSDPFRPVYVNVDAAPVSSAADAREALRRQVSRPVRWTELVRRMVADGVALFVEVGPGRVLGGLVARIDRSVRRVSVEGPEHFERALRAIEEVRGG